MKKIKRAILIVLDSVGIGELPDAAEYDDVGSNTLGHIFEKYPQIQLPNLLSLGLGNIDPSNLIPKSSNPKGAYGKAGEVSSGKDSTTGHWEIAGIHLEKPFPTFPEGFPADLISTFEDQIGCKTIGNYSASGTTIINELGDEHLLTGFPIVYTSADSVFQIAMHEAIFPIERQYEICQKARDLLQGNWGVGRVIARPFVGETGNYSRTKNRKDFSIQPPTSLLDELQKNAVNVISIGKIYDLFGGKGITKSIKTESNLEGIKATIEAIKQPTTDFIFTNLVDFDMLFGHRRDVMGYAKALEEFDSYLPEILENLNDDDLLIITADHGNDPTFKGSDHTREFIPIINFGKLIKKGVSIGTRSTFADIAATIAEIYTLNYTLKGSSYLNEIC